MTKRNLALLVSLLAAVPWAAAGEPFLEPHLAFLSPLLGKTMKGSFTTSTPEKPIVDVQRWERVLNGHAVRLTHSINNGVYGGETIILWDPQKQAVVYYYFTTAGFMTTGAMAANGSQIVTHESVQGDSDGITEVRSTCDLQPEGALHVKAEYFKRGQWTFGHEATYRPTPEAAVVFK